MKIPMAYKEFTMLVAAIEKYTHVERQLKEEPSELNPEPFWRGATFRTADGMPCSLIWYTNSLSFKIGEVTIHLEESERVEISGTWPNSFKMNLQIRIKNNRNYLIMPLQAFESE